MRVAATEEEDEGGWVGAKETKGEAEGVAGK